MMVERRAFSVVVPSFERPRRLAMCLEALAHLQYPRDGFEVIVVDDGGGVDLVPVVDGVRDRIDVTLVRRRHMGALARPATPERSGRVGTSSPLRMTIACPPASGSGPWTPASRAPPGRPWSAGARSMP